MFSKTYAVKQVAMEIINNQNLVVTFQQDTSTLTATWKDANISPDVAKSELKTTLGKIKEFKPQNILVDSRLYRLRNDAELQKWISYSFMFEVVAMGVKKYAIVVDAEYFEKIKKDDDPDEDDEDLMVLKYFDDTVPAIKWLL